MMNPAVGRRVLEVDVASSGQAQMIKARSSRVVPAAPCEVYALLIDPARRLKLSPVRAEVFFEAERPDGLRSAHLRAHSPRGGTVKTRSTDVERVENERLVVRTTTSPISFIRSARLQSGQAESETTITLEPHGNGTLVVVARDTRLSPAALHLVTALLGRRKVRRQSEVLVEQIRAQFLEGPTLE